MATMRLYTVSGLVVLMVLCLAISRCFGEGTTDCEGKDFLDCALDDNEEKNICEGKLDNCFCTDYQIQCSGSRLINIEEIYPFVSNKTTQVSISKSNISEIPDDMFGPLRKNYPDINLDRFVSLSLADNGIKKIGASAFKNLRHLKVLDLSRNQVSKDFCKSNGFLSHLQNLEILDFSNTFNKSVASTCNLDDMFGGLNMTKLTSFDLSGNVFPTGIHKKFAKFLCDSFSLTSLNLSNNNFDHLEANECMLNMKHLDMSNNNIQRISSVEMDVMESLLNLEEIYLGGNPFDCTCDTGTLQQWLNTTDIPVDVQKMICKTSLNESYIGHNVMDVKVNDVCEDPRIPICYGPAGPVYVSKSSLYIILVAAGILIIVTMVTFFVIIRRRNRRHAGGSDKTPTPTYTRMV